MNKISLYVKESYKELSEKVSWPTWSQVQQSTMIVLAATLIFSGLILAMDFSASKVLKFIYDRLF